MRLRSAAPPGSWSSPYNVVESNTLSLLRPGEYEKQKDINIFGRHGRAGQSEKFRIQSVGEIWARKTVTRAWLQCVVAFAISLLLLPASNDQAELQSCVVASWSRSLVVSLHPSQCKVCAYMTY